MSIQVSTDKDFNELLASNEKVVVKEQSNKISKGTEYGVGFAIRNNVYLNNLDILVFDTRFYRPVPSSKIFIFKNLNV